MKKIFKLKSFNIMAYWNNMFQLKLKRSMKLLSAIIKLKNSSKRMMNWLKIISNWALIFPVLLRFWNGPKVSCKTKNKQSKNLKKKYLIKMFAFKDWPSKLRSKLTVQGKLKQVKLFSKVSSKSLILSELTGKNNVINSLHYLNKAKKKSKTWL